MPFQIAISPSRRAATRFVAHVRRSLQKALVDESEESGTNQSRIASAIGVHRSVISRELNGRQDITLGRVAELAWALGREIDFVLVKPMQPLGSNIPLVTTCVSTSRYNSKLEKDSVSTLSAGRPVEVVM